MRASWRGEVDDGAPLLEDAVMPNDARPLASCEGFRRAGPTDHRNCADVAAFPQPSITPPRHVSRARWDGSDRPTIGGALVIETSQFDSRVRDLRGVGVSEHESKPDLADARVGGRRDLSELRIGLRAGRIEPGRRVHARPDDLVERVVARP